MVLVRRRGVDVKIFLFDVDGSTENHMSVHWKQYRIPGEFQGVVELLLKCGR